MIHCQLAFIPDDTWEGAYYKAFPLQIHLQTRLILLNFLFVSFVFSVCFFVFNFFKFDSGKNELCTSLLSSPLFLLAVMGSKQVSVPGSIPQK